MTPHMDESDFVNALPELLDAATKAPSKPKNKPISAPVQTALKLTPEQESNLITHAINRISEMDRSLGRQITSKSDWYLTSNQTYAGETFFGKRERLELTYHNKLEWRAFLLGGIFKDSNLSVPIARRIVRQMVARASNFFFGTDPWFAAYPQGKMDDVLSDKIGKHARWKLEQSKLKEVLIAAIELAFIRGECVVKTTHVKKDQIFKSFSTILIDQNGEPILDAKGGYIYQDSQWIPEMQMTGQTDEKGVPIQVPTGKSVLKADGKTVLPDNPIFEQRLVTQRLKMFHSPETAIPYYKDILIPINAASIDDADIVVHLYDMPASQLADTYFRKSMLPQADEAPAFEDVEEIAKLVLAAKSESKEPKTALLEPREEWGEYTSDTAAPEPTLEVAECYITHDVNGDGILEDIILILDVKNKKPIFYDYLANVTPDGKRPFEVIRVNYVDGRWYGVGGMEMFDPSQVFVDLTMNRINFAQSGSGRVTFWDPSATLEGQSNPHLKMNNGRTYTLAPGKRAEDALSYVTLPEIKGMDLFKMIEFFMQIVQLESGVVHAGDQNFAGMDSAKLATGVRNIEKSGQELFSLFINNLEKSIERILKTNVTLLYAHMEDNEVFEFFEGDAKEIIELTLQEVRDLAINVRLLLTRSKGEQQLNSNIEAAKLVQQYYSFPVEIQAKTRSLYIQALKALQINQAEEIIQPTELQPATPPGQPQLNMAAAAQAVQPHANIATPNL